MAVGTFSSETFRINSPKPGIIFSQTASVASGGDVALGWSGPAGRHHETAAFDVAQRDQGLFDLRSVVRDDAPPTGSQGRTENFLEVVANRRAAAIFVFTAAGAVGDGQDADTSH